MLKKFLRLAVVLVVVLVGVFVINMQRPSGQILTINNHKITIEIADTPAKRELGLGGRDSLEANHGMLFVFNQPDQACFWMKDMHFNLDILWFNANKQLIYQKQNLSPDTYPSSFCPPTMAGYVLEINAGEAAKLNINNQDSFNL